MEKINQIFRTIFPKRYKYDKKAIEKLGVTKRRWGLLWTLDFYILREFMIKFCVLLLVFMLGFLMGDVFDDLSDFLNKGGSMSMTVSYFLLKMPGNIRFILPISMLLSCIWTMAAFGKNLEITAMRASGVSLFRCGRAIFVVGIFVSCINIYFNEKLVPLTDRKADTIMSILNKQRSNTEQKMLVFKSSDARRSWFFKVFDNYNLNENVILKHYREDGTLQYDMNAKNAKHIDGVGWLLTDVTKTSYSADGLLPYNPEKIDKISYSESEVPENPEDILNAIQEEEDLPSWVIWDILQSNPDMSERMKDVYWTLFFYRLSFPWACFLAVFLGIPLATKGERSGIMLAIISAVGVIIAYMIVAELFLVLGKRGYINSLIAGVAPTVCFIMYGYHKVLSNQS